MSVLADRARLGTDAGRCAVAEMWLDGWKQKHIAGLFGYSNATHICNAIATFLRAYVPECEDFDGHIRAWPHERRQWVAIAIVRYLEKRVAALEAAETVT